MTPEVVTLINDATDAGNSNTWRARRMRGMTLGWALDEFTIKDKTEKRMYVCWHDADGNKVSVDKNKIPAIHIQAPVGPVKAAYVTPADVLRYDTGDPTRVVQKLVFDTENEMYDDWTQFASEMETLLNEDRATFYIDHIESHSLLDAGVRKVFAKKGREAAIEKLLDAINNSNDNSQHACAWSKAKSKVFKVRHDGDGMMVSPAAAKILDGGDGQFDPSNKIRDYLEAGDADSGKPYDLNLLRITEPDGKTVIPPHELGSLYGDGMLAMHTLTIYGINKRPDGQHSVMAFNTNVHVCTNGLPREAAPGVDVNAIVMAHAAPKRDMPDVAAIMRDAKRVKAEPRAGRCDGVIKPGVEVVVRGPAVLPEHDEMDV